MFTTLRYSVVILYFVILYLIVLLVMLHQCIQDPVYTRAKVSSFVTNLERFGTGFALRLHTRG